MAALPTKKKPRRETEYRKEELKETYKRLQNIEFQATYVATRESRYTGWERDVLKVQPSSLKMIKALNEICTELQYNSSTWKGIVQNEGEYTVWIQPIKQLKLDEEYTFRVNTTEVIDSLQWKNSDYDSLVNINVELLPKPSMTYPPPLKAQDSPFEYLRGTDLVSWRSFPITDKPQSLEWNEYGFRLHVPAGCIPTTTASQTDLSVQLNVGVSLSGQYNLPPGTQLVSALYWLRSPIKLEEPVVLEVEHSISLVDPNHCSELSFVITQCNHKELPYKFRLLEGGTFSPNSAFGSITRSKFSGIAIIKKIWGRLSSGSELVERYCGQQLYKHSLSDWTIHFVVTKNLQAQLTAVEKQHSDVTTASRPFTFEFENDDLSLDIGREGLQLESGWMISPMHSPKILKHEVDFFTSDKAVSPGFELKLRWTLKDQPPEFLNHPLTLQGAK